jgi:hypothetical protein
MSSIKNLGRFAGLLYVLTSIDGFFAMGYVPGKLIVHGNAAATASNITASETLFRLGVAGELVGQAGFIFVALALYDLLKGVDRRHSSLMVILIVVSIPIAFLNELNSVAALVLVRGADFLSIFDKPQRDALAMLFLKLHGQGFVVAEMFWGLWLFPLALLVCKSRFLPRFLGVWLAATNQLWIARYVLDGRIGERLLQAGRQSRRYSNAACFGARGWGSCRWPRSNSSCAQISADLGRHSDDVRKLSALLRRGGTRKFDNRARAGDS